MCERQEVLRNPKSSAKVGLCEEPEVGHGDHEPPARRQQPRALPENFGPLLVAEMLEHVLHADQIEPTKQRQFLARHLQNIAPEAAAGRFGIRRFVGKPVQIVEPLVKLGPIANIEPSGLALLDQSAFQAEGPRARRLPPEPPSDLDLDAAPKDRQP